MEYFDQKAVNWDNDPKRLERAAVIAKEIVEAVPGLEGMNGFEYGCGTGLLSFNLRKHLRRIVLGDNSNGMLEVLQQKILQNNVSNMETMNIDLEKESLPTGEYGIIYTLMTLHHINDIDKVAGEFHKALKSPGYLCIADLDEEDGSFHGSDFTGHNGFNRQELAERLRKLGFGEVSSKLCYEVVKTSSEGITKKYPVFLMTARKC
jgi:ubiquinone/menaquinone biosynthesis C-methylase UbiE